MNALRGGMTGRRLAPLLLFVLMSEAVAQEPPPSPPKAPPGPAKGDYVYIAATFKGLDAPSGLTGARTKYDMPPCARLQVMKAKPDRQLWEIADAMGGKAELQGPWPSRMHKGKMECEAQMSAEGEPALGRKGDRFTLVKKKPPK